MVQNKCTSTYVGVWDFVYDSEKTIDLNFFSKETTTLLGKFNGIVITMHCSVLHNRARAETHLYDDGARRLTCFITTLSTYDCYGYVMYVYNV